MKKKVFNEKILIVISIIALLLVTFLAIMHSALNIKKTQKMAQNNLIAITNGITKTVNAWLKEKKKQINFFSIKNIVKNFLKNKTGNIREFFSLVKVIDEDYENIFMVNKKGDVIITSLEGISVSNDLNEFIFWKNFVKNKYNLYLEKEIQKSPVTGKKSLIIIKGVFDKNGDLLGAIGSALDWKKFIEKFMIPNRVGQTGYISIINKKGKNIFNPNQYFFNKDLSQLSHIKKMILEKNGFLEYKKKGSSIYMSYRSLEELGWIISASAKKNELIEGSIYTRNFILIIAVIFLFLAFIKLQREIKEKEKMEKAFRESEKKYRNLVERANDGIIVVQDEKIKFFNKRITEILNYSQEELKELDFINIIAPNYRSEIMYKYNKRMRGEEITQTYEAHFLTKDMKAINVEVNAGIINYEEKSADFIFVRDITERKRIEKEKQQHYEQLVQTDKLVALGTLVSGVAHEINNPNNSIMLNTPILNEAWRDTLPILEEYEKSYGDFVIAGIPFSILQNYIFDLITDIQESSIRIKRIVEDLKNFAKPSKTELNEDININEVVRSSINLISNLVMKSTEYFNVEYDERIPLLKGNFQRLEQVIVNLIQNSCQALPDRKKGIYISTNFEKENNSVEVKVADEGAGIKPEYLKQIMDPFFTTKRDKGGMGLGLSVSMSLIKEHQGTMLFDSEFGKGTTVTIRLPVTNNSKEN